MKSLLLLLLLCSGGLSYRILFVAVPGAKSHRMSMYPLAGELAHRGHEVHFWEEQMVNEKSHPPPGVKEHLFVVHGLPQDWVAESVSKNSSMFLDLQWRKDYGKLGMIVMIPIYTEAGFLCKTLLESHTQQEEFWNFANQKWDVILIDPFFQSCGHAFALTLQQINTPLILVQTSLVDFSTAYLRANGYNPATIPPTLTNNLVWDHKSFWSRLDGVVELISGNLVLHAVIPAMINHYISSAKPQKDSLENYKRASLFFYDYPELFDWPKPEVTDLASYGSYCFGSKKPLPQDLEDFVNDPNSKGTILIAFGSIVKLNTAPEHIRNALVDGLAALKDYRIIWGYAGGEAPKVPNHIKILKWLPQFDILNHPKTKLFISHGGLKSFKECVCAETPILVIPLFGDQPRNGYLAKDKGFGEFLSKFTLTSEALQKSIRKITTDPRYQEKATKLRLQLTDRIVPALERASFMVEGLAKRGKAPEIWKPKGRQLYWFQFWCLDIVLFAFTVFVAGLYMIFKLARAMLKLCKN